MSVSLAWLVVVFSAPFVGALLYLLFGEKRLARRRRLQLVASSPEVADWQRRLKQEFGPSGPEGETANQIERLAEGALGFPRLAGNGIALLTDADAIFDAIVADIDRAEQQCDAAFYIWHEGGRSADVVDALIRAAGRGVRCRAFGDSVGSKTFLSGPFLERLRSAGVDFREALPAGLWEAPFSRADLRNHRKLLCIDHRVAYTGSQNLADPRFFEQDAGAGQWVDVVGRITGPAVLALDGVFELDWSLETGQPFQPPGGHAPEPPHGAAADIQVAPSGPDSRPGAIHQLFLAAIYSAKRELVITTPYFVPDDSLLAALISATLRGVAVTLIVPAQNDSRLVRYASAAHYDDLLSAGVRIVHFTGGLLHTKSLTIDREFSIFGSANLDIRSLWLNLEISLFLYDQAVTARLRSIQEDYLQTSTTIDLETWRRRPTHVRWAEDVCRLLSPLL